MTFEEISRINYRPFHESSISKHNYRNLKHNQGIANVFFYAYVYQYFCKINKKYGAELWNFKMANTTLVHVFNHDINSMQFEELLFYYEEALQDYFLNTVKELGFECCSSSLREAFFERKYWFGNKQRRKRFIKEHLLKAFPGKLKSWIPLYWYVTENIEASLDFLDDGRMYLLRNKPMCEYLKFCDQHAAIVENELSSEKKAIDMVIREVFNPFSYYCSKEYDICGKYVYFYFDVGYGNFGIINFLQLRPSWPLACFVYKNLMQDFKKKVELLSQKYPELREVKWT